MTVLNHNSQDKSNIVAHIENLENENGSANIANIASNELSILNAISQIASNELSILNAISQEFKSWRQKLQGIANEMRQAPDIDTLLKITVAQVREKLVCDRALIYQFTTADAGTVLAESRNLGWTPTLSENLPGITFGLYSSSDYLEAVAIDDINQIQLTPYQSH